MYALIQHGIRSLGQLTALYTSPPGKPVRSNVSTSTGSIPSLSVARYSFIQLGELWQRGMNEIAKASKRQQEVSNLFLSNR